jgi:hypothetical protein
MEGLDQSAEESKGVFDKGLERWRICLDVSKAESSISASHYHCAMYPALVSQLLFVSLPSPSIGTTASLLLNSTIAVV